MSTPQPGWYQDPSGQDTLRFFDGQQWTDLTHPVPSDGQSTPEMIAMGQQYMARAGQGYHPGQPQGSVSGTAPVASSYGNDGTGQSEPVKTKTPGAVWGILGVSLVGIIGIAIWANTGLGKDALDSGEEAAARGIEVAAADYSPDYKDLDLGAGFGCDDLAPEVVWISEDSDAPGSIVTKITGSRLTADNRDDFEFPASSAEDYAIAIECAGTATYDDGTERNGFRFELSADSYEDLWVYYNEK